MPARKSSVRLPFPLNGLNEGVAFEEQPKGTTVDCQNVRPFPADSTEDASQNAKNSGRARGGQRPGLSKYLATQWPGNGNRPSIQDLHQLVYSEFTANTGEGHTICQNTTGTGGYVLIDNAGVQVGTGEAGETFQMSCWGEDGFGYVATTNSSSKLMVRKISKTNAKQWDWSDAGSYPDITMSSTTECVCGMAVADNTLFIWIRSINGTTGEAIHRIDTSDGISRDTGQWLLSENQSTNNFENFHPSTGNTGDQQNLMSISRGVIGMLCFNNAGASGTTTNVTGNLTFDESHADVTTALRALTNLSSANVTAAGGNLPTPITVTFSGNRANQDVPKLVATNVDLTAINEVQTLTSNGGATGGTFTISVTHSGSTQTTSALTYDESAADVQTALRALSNVGSGDVNCSGGDLDDSPITCTFVSGMAGTDVTLMTTNVTSLTGGTTPNIRVSQTTKGGAAAVTVTETTQGNAEQSEVQTIEVTAASGNFTLAFDGAVSLQGLSVETGKQLFCRELQVYGPRTGGANLDAANQEISIDSDEFGNFYTISRYSANPSADPVVWNWVISKFDTLGASQWSKSSTGTTRDIAYDYEGKRLGAVGSSVQGTADNFATMSITDGTVINSQDAHDGSTWNFIGADEKGGFILDRNDSSNNVARMGKEVDPVEDWQVTHGGNPQRRIGVASAFALDPMNKLATRQTIQVAVAGGNVRKFDSGEWFDIADGTQPELPPLSRDVPVIYSAALNGKLYFADGFNIKYYDPQDPKPHGTIKAWTTTDGNIPVDTRGRYPRLIESWRGRIVMSGLAGDPQDWFMSKIGDAHDWEYAPSVLSEATATSGSNAPAGRMPDIVTSMMPLTDDILVFGGDHEIWALSGDPMQGGRWDMMSNTIGMAWGRAWCKDGKGSFYFMGSKGGVYSGNIGDGLQKISAGLIDERLEDINLDQNVVNLVWNERNQGVHIFITPRTKLLNSDSSTTEHLFFDRRTSSWWLDKFANKDHNPKVSLVIDGDSPGDRALLLGSWDGYVRQVDETATADDGTAINSHVYYGPIVSRGNMSGLRLEEMRATIAKNSSAVTYEVFRGDSAEDAYQNTSATISGSWSAGYNRSERRKARGRALYVKASNTSNSQSWAMEEVLCTFKETGKTSARSG